MYEKDCLQFGNTEKRLYMEFLNRISELPWESKSKYLPLTAILPYTGTDKVRGTKHSTLFWFNPLVQFLAEKLRGLLASVQYNIWINVSEMQFLYLKGARVVSSPSLSHPKMPLHQSPFSMCLRSLQIPPSGTETWAFYKFIPRTPAHRQRLSHSMGSEMATSPPGGFDFRINSTSK